MIDEPLNAPEMAARLGSAEYRVRLEWAHAAWGALDLCAPQDRAVVLADHLARLDTGGAALSDLLGPLALSVRKRLFVAIWETFDPLDRQAFMTRVDDGGRLLRRGAA